MILIKKYGVLITIVLIPMILFSIGIFDLIFTKYNSFYYTPILGIPFCLYINHLLNLKIIYKKGIAFFLVQIALYSIAIYSSPTSQGIAAILISPFALGWYDFYLKRRIFSPIDYLILSLVPLVLSYTLLFIFHFNDYIFPTIISIAVIFWQIYVGVRLVNFSLKNYKY